MQDVSPIRRRLSGGLALVAVLLAIAVPAIAHDDTIFEDGGAAAGGADVYTRHVLSGHETAEPAESGPPARAAGFDHVSTFTFDFDGDGAVDTGVGSITDVWEHKGFAYVGTFYEPDCSRFGTRIVDVRDPARPAYVGNVPSMPNTRVNDVKVASVSTADFTGDLLIQTQEPCFKTNVRGSTLPNKGGIHLYDVTNPARPTLLKKFYISNADGSASNFGVHNTYIWQQGAKAYVGLVDDDNARDFHIVDISKPAHPVEVARVGWQDWLTLATDPQGANALGDFAATFIHDVWVERHGGRTIAYLSYWDAGLITLDVSDPANPVFLGDSDYDTTGPEGDAEGEEGNSHVAVPAPAQDGRYVLMGDEDFSPRRSIASITSGGIARQLTAVEGAFTKPLASYPTPPLPADMVDAEGELCGPNTVDLTGKVALIKRGTCTFQLKAENARSQGAIGMVVYNDEARGDELVLMGGSGIDIFGYFVGNSDGVAIKNAITAGPTSFDVRSRFDGWGYLRVLDTSATGKHPEVESFATPNTFRDPELAGDYTMHNVVMGPAGTPWANTAFVSWYSDGMVSLDASDPTDLRWTGQWIGCYGQDESCAPTRDSAGRDQTAATNFWGVYPTVIGGQVYVLGSDRNNGLVILRPTASEELPGGLQPGNGGRP